MFNELYHRNDDDAVLGKKSGRVALLGAAAFLIIWLCVVGGLGYAAFHFIGKFW